MKEIATKSNVEHFDAILDHLLSVDPIEVNEELDQAWENSRDE